MLDYLTIGANDIARSERFYTAILLPLGYTKAGQADAVVYTLPGAAGRGDGPRTIYVRKPYDGREATAGNGSMLAFRASSHAQVRALHAAGVASGGVDEGAPGFRAEYSDDFFVAYLRDPVGNKLALFCTGEGRATQRKAAPTNA